MTKVIALANQKGGVAKTTSTINLRALEDKQATLYYGFMKDKRLKELIIQSKPSLIPSSIRLANAEPELVQEWDSASVLKTKLAPLLGMFDYILIDCPPTLTLLTVNALAAANLVLVLIPVKTDYLSIMGIPLLLQTVERIQTKANPSLKILGFCPQCLSSGTTYSSAFANRWEDPDQSEPFFEDTRVLPTMFVERNNHGNECLTEIRNSLEPKIRVFEPIKRSTAFDKSAAEARPTLEYLPNTPGVQNYYQLADDIIAYG